MKGVVINMDMGLWDVARWVWRTMPEVHHDKEAPLQCMLFKKGGWVMAYWRDPLTRTYMTSLAKKKQEQRVYS